LNKKKIPAFKKAPHKKYGQVNNETDFFFASKWSKLNKLSGLEIIAS
jgi:hypothetical protein